MDNLERRTSCWEAGSEASITGYAVVFEERTILYKDPATGIEYGEIIDQHALDGADLGDVVLRYNHQGRVLARTKNSSLQLRIDSRGLNIEADMTGSDEALSFYKDVKSGLLDKMSFAFHVTEDSWDRQTNTRRILSIDRVQDVSLVDFPAYDQTQVSARARFEVFAQEDRKAHQRSQLSAIQKEMRIRFEMLHLDEEDADDYMDRHEYELRLSMGQHLDEAEPRMHDMICLYNRLMSLDSHDDLDAAQGIKTQLLSLDQARQAEIRKRLELSRQVAAGAGVTVWSGKNNFTQTKKENKPMTESRKFFERVNESRAAGTTGTMTAIIPDTVMNEHVVETAPGAFLGVAKITGISHNGNLTLPIATLQTVERHTENSEITDAGYVPGYIVISHAEYCYNTGYSDLGFKIGAENLERIIRDTILASMLKKMDGLCVDAVAALAYTAGTNAVELATAPTYANFVQLAGLLGSDFLENAKWYMSPATYFTWLAGLKDDQGRPLLDTSKLVSEQAFCGYGIELDSQMPANTIYFGDGRRIHLNYARRPELNAWTDYDHNTQKFSVRTVAGAAAEPGCMVKMYLKS